MDYLAGIDLGSTSLKCVIYDLDGRVVARGARPTERCNPYPDHPEWTVWQPEQIWGGTAAAMKDAIAQLDDPRQHQSRGCDRYGHGWCADRRTRQLPVSLYQLA